MVSTLKLGFNMKAVLAMSLLMLGVSSQVFADCGNGQCGKSVLASGIIELKSVTKCEGVKKVKVSCIFEYGANFEVLKLSQIYHNKYGALITDGNADQLAINEYTGWNKVYLAKGDYKVISYDARNPQLVSVSNRIPKAEIDLATKISSFDELSGKRTQREALEACEDLLK